MMTNLVMLLRIKGKLMVTKCGNPSFFKCAYEFLRSKVAEVGNMPSAEALDAEGIDPP